jgi:signal peptidase I
MSILSPFRNRHPIVAVLIGYFLGISAGMAYIGRGWLCLTYLILTVLICAFGLYLILGEDRWTYLEVTFKVLLPFLVVGLTHIFVLARRIPTGFHYGWYSRWYGLIPVFLALPLALAFVIRTFIAQPFTIPSTSNLPTLVVGDYLVTSKMAYGYSQFSIAFDRSLLNFSLFRTPPRRGDMVIFGLPSNPSIDYVKRVIGVPGDRVQIKAGKTYLNDVPLRREKMAPYAVGDGMQATQYREFLPDGRSYRIIELSDDSQGDNTELFTVPLGCYFVLGDNRDNSADSRFSTGYVPERNIFAKALAVYDRTSPNFAFRKIE